MNLKSGIKMQTASHVNQKILFHLRPPIRTPFRQALKAITMSGAGSSEGVQQHSAGIHNTSRPANRLAQEQSPYLLQHAQNPASPCALHACVAAAIAPSMHALFQPGLQVDWYAWGQPAFDKAQAENKPIFLSVGYSTCHW